MSSLAARIKAFQQVRDIPYHVNLFDRERDASCIGKARKLKEILASFGIEARHICSHFEWSDTHMPPELVARAPSSGTQHHHLEVLIPETGRWTAVDPTWDIGLKDAGFPVAVWDGIAPTHLAVKVRNTFSPEQSAVIWQVKESIEMSDWREFRILFGGFYNDLNGWIAAQRAPTTGMISRAPAGREHA